MGLLHTAESWLTRQLSQAGGVPVTYLRGATSVPITLAVPASGEPFDTRPASGRGRETSEFRDWLISVSALSLLTLPREGDRVRESSGTEWEAVPRVDQPCWRYTDASETTLRIHCRRVA